MDKNKIKKEATEIMNNFMQALSDVEVEEEFELIRDKSFRYENSNIGYDELNDNLNQIDIDENFKNKFLSNAKNISGDAIIANKADWAKNK